MRKLALGILCLTAVLLLGYSGHRSYQTWKQKHLMTMARRFLAQSDWRNERLSLLELLRVNPQNVEACRLMADLEERDRLPVALSWRKRVVDWNPRSASDKLALAETAIKLHDLKSAGDALGAIGEADRNSVAFHNVAGSFFAAANELARAEAHFKEALRLDPENPALELSLAVVRLHGTNADAKFGARNILSRLGSNPTNSNLRCQAIRELTVDAIHNHQKDASLALSNRLLQETNPPFTDRLLRLEALWVTKNEGFKMELASLQREAQMDPSKVQELIMWESGKLPPGESLSWLQSLPADTQTNKVVALLKAERCVELQDWRSLQKCVEKGDWGELEPVRLAFDSRALRGQGLTEAGNREWSLALQAANNQEASLVMLLRLAGEWNWLSEREVILQTIVAGHPSEEWAFQDLASALFASGQTRSLMQLYNLQATRTPSNLAAKNNVAIMALLLNEQELKPHQIALDLYRESPTNSSFATTYAFSLYLQGKKTEALRVLDSLKPQQLETVSVAACYGILLEATGNRAKAKKYLDLASKVQMLPEERKLIDSAKRGLEQSAAPKS